MAKKQTLIGRGIEKSFYDSRAGELILDADWPASTGNERHG